MPKISNLVDLARMRADSTPSQRAHTFLSDELEIVQELNYEDLDRLARHVAVEIRSASGSGERGLLLLPPGLEFIGAYFGCLYAGCIAVPVYPPLNRSSDWERTELIAADAGVSFVVTTPAFAALFDDGRKSWPTLASLRMQLVELGVSHRADEWRDITIAPDSIAFLQYTSGSTGTPKGVMVSHANAVHNLGIIETHFEHDESSCGVIWLPPYHDMGLLGGVLAPMYTGFPCHLMSPLTFAQKPACWPRAISRYRATISGGPPFAYDLCLRRVEPELVQQLRLDSWRVAFVGADRINEQGLRRFAEHMEPAGFRANALYPCYGLAESTLMVSGNKPLRPLPTVRASRSALADSLVRERKADEEGVTLVGCGAPATGLSVAIVDPNTRRSVSDGQVGEIWVSGPSVAQGYWRKPEDSKAAFRARLANDGGREYLRTGDLGAFHDGQVVVTGRIKEVLIVRGRKYYPNDLERTAQSSHPALRTGGGAAFVREDDEQKIYLLQEVRRDALRAFDARSALSAVQGAMASEHGVVFAGVTFVRPGTLPKTSSGKVRRGAARELVLSPDMLALQGGGAPAPGA
jgi:acyl-CoA synthetase (AMP-forming)/AMP-acid ligase II